MQLSLSPDAVWRASKRGLVLAGSGGDAVLFEHARAAELPGLLARGPTDQELITELGPATDPHLVADLLTLGIVQDVDVDAAPATNGEAVRTQRVQLTRTGLMITGLDRPSRWLDRHLGPLLRNLTGRTLVAAVVIAGILGLARGRPGGPHAGTVAVHPVTQVALLLLIGLATDLAHESAHAVALSHYGRPVRRAGLGFYWGALTFFVDSTPALTLPRRARVIQASAGLGVDVVTTAVLVLMAQTAGATHHPLLATVAWRSAVLGLLALALNTAPLLQVDGHWALADLLDEPDLGPRARAALTTALRGRSHPGERLLAAYGGLSLLAGLGLIAVQLGVAWRVLHPLVTALLRGSFLDLTLGVYLLLPVALGAALSLLGLVVDCLTSTPASPLPAVAASSGREDSR